MLHPSYHDLMSRVNSEVETGEAPIVNSRYSIVLATAKRARQLIDGVDALTMAKCPKPLSVAIDELDQAKIHILSEEEAAVVEMRRAMQAEDSERLDAQEEEAVSEEMFGGEETVSLEELGGEETAEV